jgi:hypothetical protein
MTKAETHQLMVSLTKLGGLIDQLHEHGGWGTEENADGVIAEYLGDAPEAQSQLDAAIDTLTRVASS